MTQTARFEEGIAEVLVLLDAVGAEMDEEEPQPAAPPAVRMMFPRSIHALIFAVASRAPVAV